MRASDQQLQAMSNLINDPNFESFIHYLDSWLKEETKECIHAEKPAVNQGRAQVLTEIQDTIAQARKSVQQRISKRGVSSIPAANAF